MQFFAPINKSFGFTAKCNVQRHATVANLLGFCCPMPVSKPFIFNAFVAMTTPIALFIGRTIKRIFLGRSFTQISHPRRKMKPALADNDAPAPVIMEVFSVGIQTSCFHRSPSPILVIMAFAVNRQSFADLFSAIASATFNIRSDQMRGGNSGHVSTNTDAPPKSSFLRWIWACASNNGETIYNETVKIFCFLWNWLKSNARLIVDHWFSFTESLMRSVRSRILPASFIVA